MIFYRYILHYWDVPVYQSVWSKLGESQGKILYWPYYNQKLLNYAYSIPWELKLKKPKNILREVARTCGSSGIYYHTP